MPWLATSWSYSDDGLNLRITLQPHASFHDGTPVTAALLRDALVQQLPGALGPAFDDIAEVRAPSSDELVFVFKRRSTLILEGLNFPIHAGNSNVGTGPFYEAERRGSSITLRAYDSYYAGRPLIDRVVIEPYSSVRSAWADMLRGQVDMVYELGLDAFDLTRSGNDTGVFTFHRPYSYVVILNLRKPTLQSPALRRAFNSAINRDELVSKVLDGHGRSADGPIWPDHWVKPSGLSHFRYEPREAMAGQKVTFTCLYSDPSFERIALFLHQALQAVGIDVKMELASVEDAMRRVEAGDFDAWLADVGLAPSLFRQYSFWHSGSPYNWGHYANDRVDAALDAVRASRNDEEYKTGVAAFQRAMIDDPPAIFLAWSERARAVNNRFDVHEEPSRDVLNTLRLWRPAVASGAAHN